MNASVSPLTSGTSRVAGDLVAVERGHHVLVEREVDGDGGLAERPRLDRLAARPGPGSGQRPEPLDDDLRRRQGVGALVVGGLVEVADRAQVGVEAVEGAVLQEVGFGRGAALAIVRTGTPAASGRPRSGHRSCRADRRDKRPTGAGGSRRPRAGRRRRRRPARRPPRRRTPGGAAARRSRTRKRPRARSPTAARPAARPWSGPRPSRSSATISTAASSAGNACPGADTTITGPSTDRATIPVTRRSKRRSVPVEGRLRRAHPRGSPARQHDRRRLEHWARETGEVSAAPGGALVFVPWRERAGWRAERPAT